MCRHVFQKSYVTFKMDMCRHKMPFSEYNNVPEKNNPRACCIICHPLFMKEKKLYDGLFERIPASCVVLHFMFVFYNKYATCLK